MPRFVLAVFLLLTGTAVAQSRPPIIPRGYEELYKNPPTVELVTMGIGGLIWERHGHIALCVVYPDREDCYNYGVGDFHEPISMAWGFLRGTHSFWVAKQPFDEMLWIYHATDRTIWRQPLPLTPDQVKQVVDKLELDIREENKYYAYDHLSDNCTTRVRDIIDNATGGQLKTMANDPTDGKTFRDLARDGFFGLKDMPRPTLVVTDLIMGRTADRVPTYWERMFLPQYLREAVEKKWGVKPIIFYQRKGDPAILDKQLCSDGAIVHQAGDCTPSAAVSGISGRILFALAILLLTASAWVTRLFGRFERLGTAFAILPPALLGTVLWVVALAAAVPYLHINETILVLMPFDFLLILLPQRLRVRYAQGRTAILVVVGVLLLVGVLTQPILYLVLWTLIPNAAVGFWPKAWTRA